MAKIKEDKTLGLWNRLYVDHLFTTFNLQFTKNEWATMKCWTFGMKTGAFVDALNLEMLINESPNLRRLHHCIIPKDFYDANFKAVFEADHELVNEEAYDFAKQTTNFQNTPDLWADKPVTFTEDKKQTSEEQMNTCELLDEVVIAKTGSRFHFTPECKGLDHATFTLKVVTFEEAKQMGRTLCNLCEETIHFRTPTCCGPGCNLETTWHLSSLPHFCCRKCKNGEGHSHFCHFHYKTGTNGAGNSTSASSTSAMKKEARKLREAGAVKSTSSSSSTSKKK